MKMKLCLGSLLIVATMMLSTGCEIPEIIIGSPPEQTPTNVSTPTPTSPINSNWTPPVTVASTSAPPAAIGGLPDLVSVIAKVRPSVVAINTKVASVSFLGPIVQEGAGSGWIVDASGLIVTNNHVVEGATDITVTLEDGRTIPAETIRTDYVSDLAVIRIKAQNLQAVKVGDSGKMRVGDWVVCIGNSMGMGISATKGIVSALGVSITVDSATGQTLYDLIQTDAAINPGNSGGPMVNMAGEVIAINSVKVAEVGVEAMGYAISTKEALPIINDLIQVGYAIRPWMGVGLRDLTPSIVSRFKLSVDKGAMLTEVVAGGPADRAGLKVADVITAVNGKAINNVDDLIKTIRSYQIGQKADITYWRGTGQGTASITFAQSPPPK